MRQAVFKTMQQRPRQALREVARRCSTGPLISEAAVQDDAGLDQELQAAATSSQQRSDSSLHKVSTTKASTGYIPKQLTAEATISRFSPQQSSSTSSSKQRQQQQQATQQQSVQQQRRSFERRLEASVKGYTAFSPSPGAASRKTGKQLRTQQKNVHEMFTVWTTTAFYAAV